MYFGELDYFEWIECMGLSVLTIFGATDKGL